MTLISTTGVKVTLDETSGLQNDFTSDVSGDLDDNDTALALPTLFAGRLTTLLAATVPTETLMGTALSGYDGTNAGLNAFTITPDGNGTITDIRFTDSSGALLNGLDSALTTVGGVKIYLYTDTTDNNILLGREGMLDGNYVANPTGAIVFAAYIEETGSPVSGGKIWTTLYQPLHHNNPNNPDDPVDLLNKVFIGTTQDTEFSLANAPSGQNLFLMFTTAAPTVVDGRVQGVSIIATGKNPADQSSGANITTGDTINTSQAGGPTTFGTNNQMIVEQEGIRFTFVTGARQDVTIPNLDQNEADVEANIDFTAVFGARTATFDVVQLQSGKSAQVKISAFSTDAETGVDFINGYANDSTVAITNVRVINIATGQVIENSNGSVNDPGIAITFASGVATITGVKAGYKIEYTTTADHNRVLVENGAALDAKGNDHADFDIGGFKLIQASTATAEIGSKIFFEDDGPSITVSTVGTADALMVDETVLATNASASFADNFSSAPNYGADGAGTVSSAYALGVKSDGVDSGLVDVASNEVVLLRINGGVVEGYTASGNALVFTVSVDAAGLVTLDQIRALKHPDGSNPDDAVSPSTADLISLTRTDTITDKDGDTSTGFATLDIGQALSFKDDGPSITVSTVGTADALMVDETNLATNASADFSDNFTNVPNYGADGAGTVSSAYTLSVSSAGADSGLVDVASDEAVLLRVNGGVVEGYTASGNALVFTVSVDAAGLVTLDQIRALKHPDGTNPDDAVSPSAADLISLTRTDTITDKDGDTSTGFATLDIGQALSFKDDGPSITVSTVGTADALMVDETNLNADASADFSDNFTNVPNYGADGAGTVSSAYTLSVSSAGADSGLVDVASDEAVLLRVNGGVVEGYTASGNALVFTVSVDAAGLVTLDQIRALKHPDGTNPDDAVSPTAADLISLTRTDTITDKDGDTSTGTATLDIAAALSFKDDGPSIAVSVAAAADALLVDETVLATNASANFADNFSSAPNYGADGAGTVSSAYALGVKSDGVNSGLVDVASNEAVLLRVNASGVVEGYITTGDAVVFTVSVSAAGLVSLDQIRALKHPNGTNPDDAVSPSTADLISLTRTDTITDKDGDTSTGFATLDIGQALSFKDDGPTITVSTVGTADALMVDETVLATNASADFSDNFANVPFYGADGAGTVSSAYALGVKTEGGNSGLVDVASDEAVLLRVNASGVVEGYTANGNALVFTVSVSAAGLVSLDQIRALKHPNGTNPDDAVSPSTADLISLTRTDTITDKDGDTSTGFATLDIGQALSFKDDGPSITVSTVGTADALMVDETDLLTNASANFADNFSSAPNYGADGAGTVSSAYALGVKTEGENSGLVDVASDEAVLLRVNASGVVEGYTASGNALVFTVSVDAAGLVTLDQIRALKHPDGTNPDDAVSPSAADLISLTRTDTITDKDGDTSTGTATLDIAAALSFKDDGPSIAVSVAAAADALLVDETDLLTNASASFADNFSNVPNYGADGAGTVSSAYALGVKTEGENSGLVDVASDEAVLLRVNASGVVEGYTASGNALVFTVSVSAAGLVSLDQIRALKHPDGTNPDDAVSPTAADLISLTRTDTITDKDGDTSTGTATLNIAAALSFRDDGPAVSANLTVKLDDDALTGGNPGGTGDDVDAANTSGTLGHSFGADGAGSITYLTTGAPAGFSYEAGAGNSLLVKQGSTTVLTLTLNSATGAYAVTQNAPILHAAGLDENNQAFTVNYQVTDRDGDTASGTLSIDVDDDTPTVLKKTDLVYANASNPTPGGTGIFDYAIGADARLTFSSSNSDFSAITLSGTVGATAISSPTVSWLSEDADTAIFNVQFNYQPDPASSATTAATGTLTFDKVNDTYTVALAQPISGFTTLTTGAALGFTGYTAGTSTIDQTQPDVSVAQLSSDFFVQFTGYSEPGGGTGANNLQALLPDDLLGTDNGTSFVNGELFKQEATWVSVSNTANGVAGDTIQKGEVLDLDFFNTDPTGYTDREPTTQASGIFLKFDGIGSEDLVLVLKLVDPDDQSRTTKAIIIDNSDIIKFGDTIPTGYNIVLDNNDGAVIIESNDFNTGAQNYLIEGAQLLVSTEGVTGTAIDLNAVTGASGASTTFQAFEGTPGTANPEADTTDNDVIKISDIGFVTANSATLNTSLNFDVSVVDADGDASASQALAVNIVGGASLSPTSGADTFTFTDADADGLLAAVMYNITGGFASDTDKLDFATAGSGTNYAENLLAAATVSAFATAADAALNGTVQYYFGVVGADGYLATDTDGDGITSIVKLAGVTDMAFNDIV